MTQYESLLTTQQHQQFALGVRQIFSQWTAIQLGIDNSLLGSEQETREAFEELENNLVKWVASEGDVMIPKEIEDYVNDVMDEDLGLLVQDGSIKEISEKCLQMFRACAKNDFSLITSTSTTTSTSTSQEQQQPDQTTSTTQQSQNELGDRMEVTEEEPENLVDEEGFTTYKKKKRY